MSLIEQSAKGEGGSAELSIEAHGINWEFSLPLPRAAANIAARLVSCEPETLGATITRKQTPVAKTQHAVLAGTRFLVVEDEPLVALDIAAGLQEAGTEVAASTASAKEALDAIKSKALDAALLDGNLHGRPVDEIAAALTRRKVPFLFVTGYGPECLPRAFRHAEVLSKPFGQQQLIEAAARLVKRRGGVVRLRGK